MTGVQTCALPISMNSLQDELNIPDLDLIRPKIILAFSHKTSKLVILTSMNELKNEIENIEKEAKKIAKDGQKKAWENYRNSIEVLKNEVLPLVENLKSQNSEVESVLQKFGSLISYAKKDVFSLMRKPLLLTRTHQSTERQWLASK